MEDADFTVVADHLALAGVLDGHGGPECSAFVASRLPGEILARLGLGKGNGERGASESERRGDGRNADFPGTGGSPRDFIAESVVPRTRDDGGDGAASVDEGGDEDKRPVEEAGADGPMTISERWGAAAQGVVDALRHSFHRVETEFLAEARESGSLAGSCACVAVVDLRACTARHETPLVHVANLGDSRCLMTTRGGELGGFGTALSRDHKVADPTEEQRILAHGGGVLHPIGGSYEQDDVARAYVGDGERGLAVARAFGDADFKGSGPDGVGGVITAIPEIVTAPINLSLTTLCIACDGVFDVLDGQTVLEILRSAETPADGCDAVVNAALAAGSHDNITVTAITISLEPWIAEELQIQ